MYLYIKRNKDYLIFIVGNRSEVKKVTEKNFKITWSEKNWRRCVGLSDSRTFLRKL